MQIMSKVAVAAVVGMALLGGGCAPRSRPYAYVGGALLTVAGTAMAVDAASMECDTGHPLTDLLVGTACETGQAAGYMVATIVVTTGLGLLLGAAVSSSEVAPPAAGAPPAVDDATPAWTPAPPPRSPSAPSGSPLAPVQARSLSMRAGSPLAFH